MRLFLSVVLAASIAAMPAHAAVPRDEPGAVAVTLVVGGAGVVDAGFLAFSLVQRRRAPLAFELLGIGLGLASIGMGAYFLAHGTVIDDSRTLAYSAFCGGGTLIGASIWSFTLASRGRYSLVPYVDGESSGIMVAGRF